MRGTIIGLVWCVCLSVPAGELPSVDEQFEQARLMAFAGQREEARRLCKEILERSAGYSDVKVFLGRLYAWDKEYTEHVGARVAAKSARQTKADRRTDHDRLIREVVRRIQAYDKTTDSHQASLGITVPDTQPTPISSASAPQHRSRPITRLSPSRCRQPVRRNSEQDWGCRF